MPVTCTNIPTVLMVRYVSFEDETFRREAVCYLSPNAKGKIDVVYSHHADYHRSSKDRPWEHRQNFHAPLGPALVSEVTGRVMYEFWSAFGMTIRELTPDLNLGVRVPEPQIQVGEVKFAKI